MAGPATRQAKAEAVVRYGPQRFALQELIAQLIDTRNQKLHAARGAERAIQHVISVGRGETQRNYDRAEATTAGTHAMVDEALQSLGAGAAPFAAAIARERGGTTDRLTESEANSLQDLTNRRLEAASGRAYAENAATSEYTSGLGKIQRSYQELAQEEGAFTQGRIGELRKEAADRAFQRDLAQMRDTTTRRGQNLSHQDRVAAEQGKDKRAAAKKKNAGPTHIGGGGPKLASQEQHTALWQSYQSALPDARDLRPHQSYAETVRDLTNGVPGQTLTDPKTGQKIKDPGIKQRGKLAALVAADYAYYGGITQRTLDILHSRGFSVRDLKLKRAPKRSPQSLTNTVKQGAQQVADALGGIGK